MIGISPNPLPQLQDVAEIAPLRTFALAVGAILAFWQKWRADRKPEWWSRAQWAIDLASEPEGRKRAAGLQAVERLLESAGNDKADVDLLKAMATAQRQHLVDEARNAGDNRGRTGRTRPCRRKAERRNTR
ncbi:MAG TPA: hypothetical protein VN621_11015 [Arthrobacter sp.]|nr:hypothetical protein [Arthrobacter sp.]